MRRTSWVVTLFVCAELGLGSIAWAQSDVLLTIHNVTLQKATGTLTIVGVGFGTEPVVTVDGQPVRVLLGGTGTQIDVEAPAAIWTSPGTYRLTVTDATRRVGDAFVVASHVGVAVTAGDSGTSANPFSTPAAGRARAPSNRTQPGGGARRADGPVPTLAETSCVTAVGLFVLGSNTGCDNTAIGYRALNSNTAGSRNTASGADALYYNTTGNYNTASGADALYGNTTGLFNTASGAGALFSNTTGSSNTASGHGALYLNTTGFSNTASGYIALYLNTTGSSNVASGQSTLFSNTTGSSNVASGQSALFSNTTGFSNTATGDGALASNSTGNANTALGASAGFNATTGSYNVYLGADVAGAVGDSNTIRIGLPYGGGVGQNQTFIAGIYGTAITGGLPVVIDANGQLGVQTPPGSGGVTPAGPPALGMTSAEREQMTALSTVVDEQRATIAGLFTTVADERATIAALQAALAAQQARLARLEALVPPGRK